MRISQKLLDYLHRVFEKDAQQELTLRLRHVSGTLCWSVSDNRLSTTVNGFPDLSIDLAAHSIRSLVEYLAGQNGYEIAFAKVTDRSATVLLDGSGDQNLSNGDHLYGYTSLLWSYLEALGAELTEAKRQIAEMLKQLSVTTAQDVWLDELGSFYKVPRIAGETDAMYGPRIIAEVLRPRGNNIAMAEVIKAANGGLPASVVDAPSAYGFPSYDGTLSHNGGGTYNASGANSFGLFDVEFGIDLAADMDISSYVARTRDIISRMRDAGTQLRALSFSTGMSDTGGSVGTDGDLALAITRDHYHDGAYAYGGDITYAGSDSVSEVVT